MSEKFKRIAFETFIQSVGKDFVMSHADKISFSYSETDSRIEVVFLLLESHFSLPSSNRILSEEKPFERYFSLTISKSTEKCSNIVNRMIP